MVTNLALEKVEQSDAFQQGDVFSKSVCFSLTLGKFGTTRTIPKNLVRLSGQSRREVQTPESGEAQEVTQTVIDNTMFNHTKKILESETLAEIVSKSGKFKKWVEARCIPLPFIKNGIWVIPLELVLPVDNKCREFYEEREALARRFAFQELEALKQDAKERLGPFFNEADYISSAAAFATFKMDWRFFGFTTPTRLKEIAPAIFQAEQDKAEKYVGEIRDGILKTLLGQFSKLSSHLVDSLSENADGTRKKFHKTSVSHLVEFLELLPLKNLTNCEGLAEQGEICKKLLEGVDPELLKDDNLVREKIVEDFSQVTKKLDELMVTNFGQRAVQFLPEEEIEDV